MTLQKGGRRYGVNRSSGGSSARGVAALGRARGGEAAAIGGLADTAMNFFEEQALKESSALAKEHGESVIIQKDVNGIPIAPEDYSGFSLYDETKHDIVQARYRRSVDDSITNKIRTAAANNPRNYNAFLQAAEIEREAMINASPEHLRGQIAESIGSRINEQVFRIRRAEQDFIKTQDIVDTQASVDQLIEQEIAFAAMPEGSDPNNDVFRERLLNQQAIYSELQSLRQRHPDRFTEVHHVAAVRKLEASGLLSELRTGMEVISGAEGIAPAQAAMREVITSLRTDPNDERWAHLQLTQDDRNALATKMLQSYQDLSRGVSRDTANQKIAADFKASASNGTPVRYSLAHTKWLDKRAEETGRSTDFNEPLARAWAVSTVKDFGILSEKASRYLKSVWVGTAEDSLKRTTIALSMFDDITQMPSGHHALSNALTEEEHAAFTQLRTLSRFGAVTPSEFEGIRLSLTGDKQPIREMRKKYEVAREEETGDYRKFDDAFREHLSEKINNFDPTDNNSAFLGLPRLWSVGENTGLPPRMFRDIKTVFESIMAGGGNSEDAMEVAVARVSTVWTPSEYAFNIEQQQFYRTLSDGAPRVKTMAKHSPETAYALDSDHRFNLKGMAQVAGLADMQFVAEAERQIKEKMGTELKLGREAFLAFDRLSPDAGGNPKPLYKLWTLTKTGEMVYRNQIIDLRDWHTKATVSNIKSIVDKEAKSQAEDRERMSVQGLIDAENRNAATALPPNMAPDMPPERRLTTRTIPKNADELVGKTKIRMGEHEVDPLVRKDNAFGPAVVNEAVSVVDKIFGGGEFLRRVAAVESDNGSHPNTFRLKPNGGDFGIFQINRHTGFPATKDVESHPLLAKAHKKIQEELGIDWMNVSYEQLRQPLMSALAARLLLLSKAPVIPKGKKAQAAYWKRWYNTSEGKGKIEDFIKKAGVGR